MGRLSQADVEALRCLTQDDDFIGEQNYTTLHKIILGLLLAGLEQEICLHPEEINNRDVMDRTPLAWAAYRGDDRAIVTLLSHRAEVNTLDRSTLCTSLLCYRQKLYYLRSSTSRSWRGPQYRCCT